MVLLGIAQRKGYLVIQLILIRGPHTKVFPHSQSPLLRPLLTYFLVCHLPRFLHKTDRVPFTRAFYQKFNRKEPESGDHVTSYIQVMRLGLVLVPL